MIFIINFVYIVYYLDQSNCTDGDVRLIDGYIKQEGRIEVCINQVWGSICNKGWDKTDAHIVCQQLGYPEQGKLYTYMHIITIHSFRTYSL